MGDTMVYQARKQLSTSADKLQKELKELVEKNIAQLEEEIKTNNVDKIRASINSLQKHLMEIGSAMYSQQLADIGKQQRRKETSLDNREVIDADFTSQN